MVRRTRAQLALAAFSALQQGDLLLACAPFLTLDHLQDKPWREEVDVWRMPADKFKKLFRFNRHDLVDLVGHLGLPARILVKNQRSADVLTAFCWLLFRLAQATTWIATAEFFGTSERRLRAVAAHLQCKILLKWKHLLKMPQHLFTAERLRQ